MTRFDTSPCKGARCGRPIVWAVVQKDDGTPGKVPLDPRSPVYRVIEGSGPTPRAARDPDAMVLHHATCPDVVDFARASPKRGELQGEIDELRQRLQGAKDEIAVLKSRLSNRRTLFDRPDSGDSG